MNNETQPTPEQLQAWRELFEDGLHRFAKKRSGCGLYVDHTVHEQWQGYLRAKQENEQALPLITGEPVRYEYQAKNGLWFPFTDQRHHDNTVADGTYPIRPLYTHAQPLPKGEPEAWLISFKDTDGNQRSRVYTHNAIGDYRQIDPNATSEELFTHAQPLQPITADDITDEMVECIATHLRVKKEIMSLSINAWIKHKGDTK